MGLPPGRYRLEATLMELSFGAWEGLTWAEIRARDPAAVAARRADKWGFAPPGGESYAMLAERVRGWLDSLAANPWSFRTAGSRAP
jgi:probable phosphoglycerate mutase